MREKKEGWGKIRIAFIENVRIFGKTRNSENVNSTFTLFVIDSTHLHLADVFF